MLKGSKRSGFTLIEIMITVAIIVILTSLLLVYLNPQGRLLDANNRVRIESQRELRNALVQYHADHNAYPPGITGEQRSICSYGVTNEACINLDVLVHEGFLDELPQDEESEAPASGYLVYLDKDNDIVTLSEHILVNIASDVPLVFSEVVLPTILSDSSNPIENPEPETIRQVAVLLPVIIDLWSSSTPPVTLNTISIPPVPNPLPTGDSTVAASATIIVDALESKSCQVLPPFSKFLCNLQNFSLMTDQIQISAPFQITTPELGTSNRLDARRWQVQQVSDIVTTGGNKNDLIEDLTLFQNELYFSANDGPNDKRYLFKTNGEIISQVTEMGLSPSEGDIKNIWGEYAGNLYFVGLDDGVYRTNGQEVIEIINNGNTFSDPIFFNGVLHFIDSDHGLYKTDGSKLTQIATNAKDGVMHVNGNWLYYNGMTGLHRTNGEVIEHISNQTFTKWVSDTNPDILWGAASATQKLYRVNTSAKSLDIMPNNHGVQFTGTMFGDTLYFRSGNEHSLYRIKDSANDTEIEGIAVQEGENDAYKLFHILEDELYFVERSTGLQRTDGTTIYDIGTHPDGQGSIFGPFHTVFKGALLAAIQSVFSHDKLFQTDGTYLTQISNTNPSGADMIDPATRDGKVIEYKDALYFVAANADGNKKLFRLSLVE